MPSSLSAGARALFSAAIRACFHRPRCFSQGRTIWRTYSAMLGPPPAIDHFVPQSHGGRPTRFPPVVRNSPYREGFTNRYHQFSSSVSIPPNSRHSISHVSGSSARSPGAAGQPVSLARSGFHRASPGQQVGRWLRRASKSWRARALRTLGRPLANTTKKRGSTGPFSTKNRNSRCAGLRWG